MIEIEKRCSYHVHSRALRGAFDGKFRIKPDLNRSKYFKPQKHRLPLAKPWNCGCMKASKSQYVELNSKCLARCADQGHTENANPDNV